MREHCLPIRIVTILGLLLYLVVYAQQRITLTLAAIANDQEQVRAVVAEYMRQNPNITINTSFAPIDQYNVVLRTQLTSGTAPDILFVFAGGAGNPMSVRVLAENGYLADLSDQSWVRSIPAGDRSSVQFEGKTYILPINKLIIGLFYNKKIFQDLGIKTPRTWSELLSACEALKQKGIVPIALANQTAWVTQLISHAITATTVYAKDPDFDLKVAQGRASFSNSAGYKEALQKYIELNRRDCFNKFPNGTAYEEVVQMVASGKAAMAVQTSGLALQVARYGMTFDQLGIIPFPSTNDATRPWIFASIISSYGVNASSRNLTAAKDFITYLAQPETLNLYLGGRIPAIPNPLIRVDPLFTEILQAIREGRSAPVGVFWPNPKVQDTYLKGIQQLFDGLLTIEQLLAQLDKVAGEK